MPSSIFTLPWALATLALTVAAQSDSKRGISVLGDDHQADWSLLTSEKSALSWYWNWSPWPASSTLVSGLTFVPQIHGIDNIAADVTQVQRIPDESIHLMTFNEPDGTTQSGGSSISPEDAAEAYIDHILPLRKSAGGRFLISHPATTGSPMGLDWLRRFNSSCYDINPSAGCPLDFITAHWYGNFDGLASWVSQLDLFYNGNSSSSDQPSLRIWITELALPQSDEDATVQMMNQSLPYLDTQDIVEGYAWFGMFRIDESNEWTGKEVALFEKDGALTELGAMYLSSGAGNESFTAGQKGTEEGQGGTTEENDASSLHVMKWVWSLLAGACVAIIL